MKRGLVIALMAITALCAVGCKGTNPDEDGDAVIRKNQQNAQNPPELSQNEKDVLSRGVGPGQKMGGKK